MPAPAAIFPQRILVLRLSAIGDLVLTTPLLRDLRKRFPRAAIDMAVKEEFCELVRHHPAVNLVHTVRKHEGLRGLLRLGMELRRRKYDVVLDLHRNFRTILLGLISGTQQRFGSHKHRLRRWFYVRFKWNTMARIPPVWQRYMRAAAPLGVQEDDAGTEIFWTAQHEQEADGVLLTAGWKRGQKMIGLAPGAGFFTKRWPLEHFVQLVAGILQEDGACAVAVLGGAQDCSLGQVLSQQGRARILDLTGKCSLLASAAIVKRCQLLVANDSGLMHLAEAVRTPVLALFGSTTKPLGFFPQLASSRVIENQRAKCRPCSHLGYRACPLGHFRCMREILPQQVFDQIREMKAGTQHNC